MAAFCACCGTEITAKAEACPKCGTPRHGMLPPDLLFTLNIGGLSPFDGETEISQGELTPSDQVHKGRDQFH
jgi:hypothetical protein